MDELAGCSNGLADWPAHLSLLAQSGDAVPPSLVSVVVAFVAVVVLSFLASMTEASFLSLSMLKSHALLESENRFERMAGRMRQDFAKPLATIVVVNNIANITGSAVFGFLINEYLHQFELPVADHTAAVIASIVLTLAVILAGEIVPKTIGERYPVKVTRGAAPIVRGLQTTLSPIIWLINLIQRPFMRPGSRHVTSEAEITRLTELGREQGAIEADEGDMIQRVFRLNDITAEAIMTPRVEMTMLEADLTLGSVADKLGEITRSRIPLFRENRDEIVAILDRPDALLALAKDQDDLLLTHPSVTFKPYFVPESMPADALLVRLQRRTQPIAIVVGEYGEAVGLVTLEDVLEEIVGEIVDEEDFEGEEEITRVADDEVLCDGRAEVNEINAVLGTEIPNHRTIAGLLLDEMERIPRMGEAHEAHGVIVTVKEANEKAILKVHVKRLPDPDEDENSDADA